MIEKVIIAAALAVVSLAESYGVPSYGYGRLDDYKYAPRPYDMGYETIEDDGTTTFRKESGDGNGNVQGSYGYRDSKGLERVVDYVADEKGFRAQVKTNEPGTDNQNPADVLMLANPVVFDYAPEKYGAASRRSYGAPLRGAYSEPRPVYSAPRSGYAVPRSLNLAPRSVYGAPRLTASRLPYGVSNPSLGVSSLPYGASRVSPGVSKGVLIPSGGVVKAAGPRVY